MNAERLTEEDEREMLAMAAGGMGAFGPGFLRRVVGTIDALRADLATHCAHLRAVSGALVDAGMAVGGEDTYAGAVRELAKERDAALGAKEEE